MTTQKPKVQTLKISPATAKKMLEINTHNRPLSEAHVKRLTNAMKKDQWKFCGDPIRISEENVLLDGQHRLHAIVNSGVTVEMIVITGLPEETFHVIDTGKKGRIAADILAMSGERSANELAAVLTMIYVYEHDDDFTDRHLRPSITDIEDCLSRHPGVRDHINTKAALNKLIGNSLSSTLSYLFAQSDATKSALFMDRLATGVGLEQGNPILQVREMLIANKTQIKKFSKRSVAALVIKAFNYYIANKAVSRVIFRNDEKFPAINGMKMARFK